MKEPFADHNLIPRPKQQASAAARSAAANELARQLLHPVLTRAHGPSHFEAVGFMRAGWNAEPKR